MEAAGLAISIASLASLFQTTINCFENIQIAKAFGVDFQTSCLKLGNTQLRLTRWGEAVGFGARSKAADSPKEALLSEQDFNRVRDLLGHIINLFKRAEDISNQFRAEHGNVDAVDVHEAFEGDTASMRQRMRDICLRRQGNTSRMKKAKWALYEKENLNSLIEDLRKLVNDLVELFPATKTVQEELSSQEAAEMRDEPALLTLKEIAAQQDRLLEEAITKLTKQSVSKFSRAFGMLWLTRLRQSRLTSGTMQIIRKS